MVIFKATLGDKKVKFKGKIPKILPIEKLNQNVGWSTAGVRNETFTAVTHKITITIDEIDEINYEDLEYLFMMGISFTMKDTDTGFESASHYTFEGNLSLEAIYDKGQIQTIYTGSVAVVGTGG